MEKPAHASSVTVAFAGRAAAEAAIEALEAAGVGRQAVRLEERDVEQTVGSPVSNLTGAHRLAIGFAIAGAVLGSMLTMLAATGAIHVPALGLVESSFPAAVVRGLAAGGAIGMLFGYILGMAMWDDIGEPTPEDTVLGGFAVRVTAPEHADVALELLKKAGGWEVRS